MDHPDEPSTPTDSPGSADPADGHIDFSPYSIQQLHDFRLSMDARRFPLNVARLQAELIRRESSVAPRATADVPVEPVRFTRRAGLFGWLEAKRRRQRVYGPGSLEVRAGDMSLRGWQRTWLGVQVQAEVAVPLSAVRNVAYDGRQLWFQERQHRWWPRRYELSGNSPEFGPRIAAKLPRDSAEGFEEKWQQMRQFSRRLDANNVRPWVTPALVAVNVLAFLAFLIAANAWSGIYPQQLVQWGGNYGPFTTHGQWWRLVSALFMHFSLIHLLVNMWALWNIGYLAERLFGSTRFLLIYLGAGLVASLTSIAWDPARLTVGASGAIFGIFGAFLACLLRPATQTPAAVLRTHWLSTAVFVLFSLLNGYFQVATDNAAHVGGLLIGLALGWILAEPQAATSAPRVRSGPIAVALALVAIVCALGYAQVHGIGKRFTAPQAFLNAHNWFVVGEPENLRHWRDYAAQATQGSISQSALAEGFKRDLLPFWQSTVERLQAENGQLPADQRAYGADILNYAEQRRDWVAAVAASGDGTSSVDGTHYAQLVDKALARIERRQLDANATLQPHALSQLPWFAKVRRLVDANSVCVQEPAALGYRLDPHDRDTDGPAERFAIGCASQRAFLSSDYAAIEGQMIAYPPGEVDPVDGGSRRIAVLHGLSNLLSYGQIRLDAALAATADWRKQFPQSLMPDLVEASLFQDWAWSARGHGFAKQVAALQWQQFAHRTAMAAAVLEDIADRGGAEPMWYELRLSIGLDQSDSKEDLQTVFDRGTTRFPNFLPLYSAQLRGLLPRWGGSYEEVDAMITKAAGNVSRSDELYAQLYWIDADLERDTESFFSDSKIDWARATRGFRSLLSSYPKSDAVLNGFAYMACRAADKALYRSLRQYIVNGRISRVVWPTQYSLESCDKSFN